MNIEDAYRDAAVLHRAALRDQDEQRSGPQTVVPPERKSRRDMYAQIARTQGLPMPEAVALYDNGIMTLSFTRVDDGVRWCRRLGCEPQPRETNGRLWVGQYELIMWDGWSVNISATEDAEP